MSIEIWNRAGGASPGDSSSAADFRSLAGMVSVPVALWCYKSFKSLWMPFASTFMGGALWVLLGPRSGKPVVSSLVYTKLNGFSMMFAWFCGSQKINPSCFNGAIPVLSFFFDLMKFQYLFGFLLSLVRMTLM